MFSAVIFDRDGVLVDSEGTNIDSAEFAFKKFGHQLTESDKSLVIGRHSDDYIPDIIKKNKLELDFGLVRSAQSEKYHQLWNGLSLVAGVEELLKYLKYQDKIMAIATNSGRESTLKLLNDHSIEKYFSVVVTGEDIYHRKPNPEIYLLTVEKLKIGKNKVLVVEDTEVGVAAAKAAGLRCVAVPNVSTQNQDFSEADAKMASLLELKERINRF